MREPEAALVYSPREWAERLSRFVADHGGLRIRAKVLDPAEALEQRYDVLVVDDFTHFLSRRFVDGVRRAGRRVLGVYDPAEPGGTEDLGVAGKERLRQCDVDDVIEAQAPPEEFVAAITALAATMAIPVEESAERILPSAPSVEAGPGDDAVRRGSITVVGAASGGCGATEIAVALAAAATRRGESAVLVDADDVQASIAQRLGLPVWPNIRAAVDAFHEAPDRLAGALTAFPGGAFEVLCGLSNPSDWSMLRPAEVVGVCRDLAGLRHHVIVNVGPRVEDLGWLGEPERYGITRGLLATADVLIGVGLPSPVGVARLLAWIAEVRAITNGNPAHLVLNRSPGGGFRRAEVDEELKRAAFPASVTFVPEDPRVGAAAWEGSLAEHGPFRKAMATLAEAALPVFVPPERSRRRWVRRLRR